MRFLSNKIINRPYFQSDTLRHPCNLDENLISVSPIVFKDSNALKLTQAVSQDLILTEVMHSISNMYRMHGEKLINFKM